MGQDRHTPRSGSEGRESPPPELAADPLLDRAVVDRLCADFDRALRRRLLDLFVGQAPGLLATLRDRVAREDPDGVVQSAHKLRGSCLNLGAGRMSRVCRRLEQTAGAGDLAQAPSLLEDLDRAFEATRTELSTRLVGP